MSRCVKYCNNLLTVFRVYLHLYSEPWICAIPTLASRGRPVTAQRADTCASVLTVTIAMSA